MRRVWLLLLTLCLASPLHATTVKRLDLDGLIALAQSIVVGTVRDSESYWSPDGRLILTRHTIEIGETLKGAPSGALQVTTIGGTIGDATLHVAGMPAFARGEHTVVFVEHSGPYRVVAGLSQGKFSIIDGLVSNDISDLNFADGKPGRAVRLPVDDFIGRIRRRLGR